MIEFAVPNFGVKRAAFDLPNPVFSNAVAVDATVDVKRTMSGDLRSYVKSSDSRFNITMDFENIGYGRTKTVSDFFRAFAGLSFGIQDHDGQKWTVQFVMPWFNFTVDRRSGPENGFRAEVCSFTLEFTGVKSA